ncbi:MULTISPECIES: SDR family oxidoreductase [unclassified Nocardia]|uniref:SDR family oxidoreductase n=1 Tax=unclassified Nocardia TaxID=2637762 RepID=UPI0033AC315E
MIVVTGATGNIGRQLVGLLAEAGERVRAVSRGTTPVDLPAGVEHVVADLGDLDSLSPALQGADALFLLITGEQLMTGPEPADLLKAAAAAGIRRVVFVSSQGAVTRPDSAGYARTIAFELALAESDLAWTALRPGAFFSNTYAWIEPVRTARTVAAPFGDVGLPAVDPGDIAAVAAVALREDGHAGRAYTLTGPAVVTPRDQAAALAVAIDDPIDFVELTAEQAKENMLRFMPAAVADHTLTILGTPTVAEQQVSGDIERVLGRPATAYAEWALGQRAMFR